MTIDSIVNKISDEYAEVRDKFCMDIYAKFYSIDQLKLVYSEPEKLKKILEDDGWSMSEVVSCLGSPIEIALLRGKDIMGRFQFKVNYVTS